jgi:hypothetical protein
MVTALKRETDMAKVKYFSGETEVTYPYGMDNAKFAAAYGIKGVRSDSFQRLVGKAADGRILPVERFLTYKSSPSLHKCDARCLNAKVGGSCECSCGGKNHGAGNLLCEAA